MTVKSKGGASTHERLADDSAVKGSSDRSFGIVFAVVFALIGLWPFLFGGLVRWWSLAIALGFAAVTVARPGLLAPLNRLWFKFGLLLNSIVSPIVMGVVFLVCLRPVGVFT